MSKRHSPPLPEDHETRIRVVHPETLRPVKYIPNDTVQRMADLFGVDVERRTASVLAIMAPLEALLHSPVRELKDEYEHRFLFILSSSKELKDAVR